MIFLTFIIFLIVQRIGELAIARRNERWMKENGAIEVGKEHYPYIVLLHTAFIVTLIVEVLVMGGEVSPYWPFILPFFVLTQLMRGWSLASLGKYWNTKIIILPNASIVKKGPYRFLRHPNYVIVVLEILLIPLLFQAYWTCAIFSILNAWVLSIRIPMEEKALIHGTDYLEQFEKVSRFTPFRLKKYKNDGLE